MTDYMHTRRGEESDSFFCRFTFGQFFALLVLEVFTLFFVFYLGARYGREFLGLDKPAAVAEQQGPATAEVPTTGDTKVSTTADAEVQAMAKDLIAKAQTPELKDRISKMIQDAGGQQGVAKTPEVIAGNRGEAEPNAAAGGGSQAPAAGEAPTEAAVQRAEQQARAEPPPTAAEEKAAENTAVRVKSVENARYSVQIGSYPQMGEANRVAERWKTKGYPAYVMIADIPDRGRWYRVRLGGFQTRDDAGRYLKELQKREDVEALIVMNEQ